MSRFFIRFFSSLLILAGFSQTYAMPPKPAKCPDASMIKSAGLSYTELDEDGYTAYQINNYGTQNTWAFGIIGIHASSRQEALGIGYQTLSSLQGSPSPMAIESENIWACLYASNSGLLSLAFTPLPVAGQVSKAIKFQSLQ